jgi:hypothetical protein
VPAVSVISTQTPSLSQRAKMLPLPPPCSSTWALTSLTAMTRSVSRVPDSPATAA